MPRLSHLEQADALLRVVNALGKRAVPEIPPKSESEVCLALLQLTLRSLAHLVQHHAHRQPFGLDHVLDQRVVLRTDALTLPLNGLLNALLEKHTQLGRGKEVEKVFALDLVEWVVERTLGTQHVLHARLQRDAVVVEEAHLVEPPTTAHARDPLGERGEVGVTGSHDGLFSRRKRCG